MKREAKAISISIDQDTVAWALAQADAIEQGNEEQVDRAEVAEELRDMAKLFGHELYERLLACWRRGNHRRWKTCS